MVTAMLDHPAFVVPTSSNVAPSDDVDMEDNHPVAVTDSGMVHDVSINVAPDHSMTINSSDLLSSLSNTDTDNENVDLLSIRHIIPLHPHSNLYQINLYFRIIQSRTGHPYTDNIATHASTMHNFELVMFTNTFIE